MNGTTITVSSMPLHQPLFFPFFSALLFPLLLAPPTTAQYLYTNCNSSKSGNYTQNSIYQSNLNTLLPSLPVNASHSSGFYYTSSGTTSNKINGMALCRGDVAAATCKNCLQVAQEQIKQDCAYKKAAIIYYDYCMLRYADTNFSFFEDDLKLYIKNPDNVSDTERLRKDVLGELMPRIVSEAIGDHPDKPLFATDEVRFDDFNNLYGLVQCTRDLSKSDCRTCLENLMADIPSRFEGSKGARIIAPNCILRYEFYQFYNSSSVIAQPPSTSPPIIDPSMRNTTSEGINNNSRRRKMVLLTVLPVVALIVFVVVPIIWTSYRKKKKGVLVPSGVTGETSISDQRSKFPLSTIISATKNFAKENKLGEGGYGIVYKGILARGREIAVKRLSSGSRQGVQEFINEVSTVAKLQHRNLVRLLGCCAEGGEQILVYEYVPNKSLDQILFDEKEKFVLNWTTRYKIIGGIVRGLLYIHEDSRLKIIHRDLKASNVLLDSEMNPKIADFGLAKIIGGDQTHGETDRIAGTYGYMAPEYVQGGTFSVKSDVYSFGLLLIEILTGQKNSTYYYKSQCSESLHSHAWKHWNSGSVMNIIDMSIRDECPSAEACKCIHIALLCLQEDAQQRPTMSMVNQHMLNRVNLSAPLPPTFHQPSSLTATLAPYHSTSSQRYRSSNEVTMSELAPR